MDSMHPFPKKIDKHAILILGRICHMLQGCECIDHVKLGHHWGDLCKCIRHCTFITGAVTYAIYTRDGSNFKLNVLYDTFVLDRQPGDSRMPMIFHISDPEFPDNIVSAAQSLAESHDE
jgi:hypothetical protein